MNIMMRNRYWFGLVFILVFIIIYYVAKGFFYENAFKNDILGVVDVSENTLALPVEYILTKEKYRLNNATVSSDNEKVVTARISNTKETVSVLQDNLVQTFSSLLEMDDTLQTRRKKKEVLHELLASQDNIDEAKSILSGDVDIVDRYGENQAMMRVFAIKLLKEQANLGYPNSLIEVTNTLARNLSDVKSSGSSIELGRQYDLEDLLRSAVTHYDISLMNNNLASVANELGFDTYMHNEIVDIYDDSFFFPLMKKYGREKASMIVEELMPKRGL